MQIAGRGGARRLHNLAHKRDHIVLGFSLDLGDPLRINLGSRADLLRCACRDHPDSLKLLSDLKLDFEPNLVTP
jgi:hypothetical protein